MIDLSVRRLSFREIVRVVEIHGRIVVTEYEDSFM